MRRFVSALGRRKEDVPTDDAPHTRRTWKSWLSPKRTPSARRVIVPDPEPHVVPEPVHDAAPDTPDAPHHSLHHTDADVSDPHDSLRVLTRNRLVPPPSVSPFSPPLLFPRSTLPTPLPRHPSLRVDLARRRLLAALDADAGHRDSIQPFALRPAPVPVTPPPPSFPDVRWPSSPPTSFSPGVRRWIARPCFEERYLVYSSADSAVTASAVSAASLAVAALEFSDQIDTIAYPDLDALVTPQPKLPDQPSRNSYTAVPSPLRQEHSPSPPSSSPKSPHPPSSVKRVVRFAEDDSSDDSLPLHLVRQKKKREQKSKFLRQEQLRRAKENDARRRKREQEAFELESRRAALEAERLDREKAQYAEHVAATRARRETQRAGGVPSLTSSTLLAPNPSYASLRDSQRNRPPDNRRASSYKLDDPSLVSPNPRRETSDSAVFLSSPSSYHQTSDSSPSSSRPPSIVQSPVSLNLHSRPASTHSSSSEDARHASKRHSMAAASNIHPMSTAVNNMGYPFPPPIIMSYPTWSGSNPNFHFVPPVPPVPDFAHEMPLLPPAAPFMKQTSYDRSSSRNSSPVSSSPSSRRESFSSSSERLNQLPVPPSMSRGSSKTRADKQSSSSSSRPSHSRRGSGDSKVTSHTQQYGSRPPPTTTRSQPVVSRGRPPHPSKSATTPSNLVQPSPWTALPTQTGMAPVAMPLSPYSHTVSSTHSLRNSMRMGMSTTGAGATGSLGQRAGGKHGQDWRQSIIS